MKLLTASNPAAALWALPFKDKLRVSRTLALVQVQAHQKIKPYQQLRYGSNTPFRHGPIDVVKYSATPLPDNSAQALRRSNPNALQDELVRHLNEDSRMSSFEFGVQFLDAKRMTYWGQRLDASFWTENASIQWQEAQAPSTRSRGLRWCQFRSFRPASPMRSFISMSPGTPLRKVLRSAVSIAPASMAKSQA